MYSSIDNKGKSHVEWLGKASAASRRFTKRAFDLRQSRHLLFDAVGQGVEAQRKLQEPGPVFMPCALRGPLPKLRGAGAILFDDGRSRHRPQFYQVDRSPLSGRFRPTSGDYY